MSDTSAAGEEKGIINDMDARVAVVDDEPLFLEFMDTLLEHYGYDVLLLDTATGAVEALVAYAPDLIILDLLFGHEAAGCEVLAALRTQPSLVSTPVILCTAAPQMVGGRVDELHKQHTWVLAKPFHLEAMNRLLYTLLAQCGMPQPK